MNEYLKHLRVQIKKHSHMTILLTGLFLASFILPPLNVLFLLLFPTIVIFDFKKPKAYLYLPLAISLNFGITIIFGAALGYLGLIGIGSLKLLAYLASILILGLGKQIQLPKTKLDTGMKWGFGLLYGILFVSVFAKIASIYQFSVPILHDPIAHAFWANKIAETNTIDYYYSPGLHIWIYIVAESFSTTIAYSTLIVSNALNAFVPFGFGYLALLITRSTPAAISAALLLTLAPYPTRLYTTAGKNGLTAGMAFMPFAYYFFLEHLKKPNIFTGIFAFIATLALGLIHFPTAGFVIAGLATYGILFKLWPLNKQRIKELVNIYWPQVLATLGIGFWLLLQYSDFSNERGAEVDRKSPYTPYQGDPLSEFLESAGKTFEFFYRNVSNIGIGGDFKGVFLITALVALIYILLISKPHRYVKLTLSTLVGMIIMSIFFYSIKLFGFFIFISTAKFLIYPLFAMLISSAVFYIFKFHKITKVRTVLFIGAMAFMVVYYHTTIYKQYNSTSQSLSEMTVNDYDLKAYEWLETNVDSSDKILVNATQSQGYIIFASDGASWIPVFTGLEISAPFQEIRFSDKDTNDLWVLYEQLKNPEYTEMALKELVSRGFVYYYYDKTGWLVEPLDVESLNQSIVDNTVVYENEEVRIYRIGIK